jgi:MFS family permease
MAILLLIPFGILSDRYGRKPMILYPRAIMFIGTLIRVFARTPYHLIIAAIVGGFAGGSYFPILLSMIADISNEEEQREGISTLFLFSSIGMVVGPSLAAFLLLFPQITMRNIYQITAISQLGALFYLVMVIRETNPPIGQKETEFIPQIKELINKTSFQGLLFVAFLYSFYHSIFRTYTPIYGRLNLGLSDAEVASFNSIRNLGVMLIRLSLATFLTGSSISVFLIIVLVLGGLSGLFVSFASNYTFMVLILFFVGASFGAFRILSSTLVANNSDPGNRGLANSLLNFSQSTGNLMNIFTSSLAETYGLIPVFILSGLTCLSAIIPTLRTKLGQ